jgi:hypothetical protein
MRTKRVKTDVRIVAHGSVTMIHPLTKAALAWVRENVALESWAWFGGGFACEPRYVDDLIDGMAEEGLVVV